jgi:hypothetical protein
MAQYNATHQDPWWHAAGFSSQPQLAHLNKQIVAYRVWGGTSTEDGDLSKPLFLTFEQPVSRSQAEGFLAVWEWGNACRFVTAFRLLPGATIFVGKVHPGDSYVSGLGPPGSQIFIEPAERAAIRKIGVCRVLHNDVGAVSIVPNRDPGKARSS